MEVDQKLVVTIPYYGTDEAKQKSQKLQELYIKLGYSWAIYNDNEPHHLDKPYIVLDKDCKRFYFASYLIGDEKLMGFDTAISEAEKQLSNLVVSNPVQLKPLMQRDHIIQAVNTLTDICHSASRNAGWWHDIKTGESLKRNKGEMLMLMVSELAEAMEADRKSIQDDHLPQYDGVSVEIADCLIRIFDFVGGFGLKTAEAMADKIEYNANRADHKIENRLKDNGKKY